MSEEKPAVILYIGTPSARDAFVLSKLEAAYLDRGLIVDIRPDYVTRPALRPAAEEMVWFEEEAAAFERGQVRRFMIHVDELPYRKLYIDKRAKKNEPWYRSFDKRNKGF